MANKRNEDAVIDIFFSNTDANTMTVNCFDEDSEMAIIIRDNGKKAIYLMTVWEVKQLKKWFNEYLKNNKENNQL